jgi:hypothetical protein
MKGTHRPVGHVGFHMELQDGSGLMDFNFWVFSRV